MPDAPAFDGFPREGLAFLRGLAASNDRGWFERNRGTYADALQAPAKAFVVAYGAALAERLAPGIQAEPSVGRSLFRINRDLRFSRDRTPYNPWLDLAFWEGPDPRASPALFLRLEPDRVTIGAGVMALRDDRLAAYRAAVADDRGARLEELLERLVDAEPGVVVNPPTRARVPAGYPADHARAGLLRRDALHAFAEHPIPGAIETPAFVDWCLARHGRLAGLLRWLVDAVG
ncbi:MAG: DUF2461 domain-containing protein [Thermoleophilia bacterium]